MFGARGPYGLGRGLQSRTTDGRDGSGIKPERVSAKALTVSMFCSGARSRDCALRVSGQDKREDATSRVKCCQLGLCPASLSIVSRDFSAKYVRIADAAKNPKAVGTVATNKPVLQPVRKIPKTCEKYLCTIGWNTG